VLETTAANTPAAAPQGDGKPFQDALGAALQAANGETSRQDVAGGTKPVEGQNLAIDGNGLPLLALTADEIPPVPEQQGEAQTQILTLAAPLPIALSAVGDGEQPVEAVASTLNADKPAATEPSFILPKPVLPAKTGTPQASVIVQAHASRVPNAEAVADPIVAVIDDKTADALMGGTPMPERSGIPVIADATNTTSLVAPAPMTAAGPSAIRTHAEASSIPMPLASSRWGEALGERVVWMTNNQIQSAQIRINPPDLGPLEVRITVDQGQASVQFSSAHGEVRDAVQAALPRLKEMLGEAGVALLDVDVSARSFAQQRQDSRASQGGGFSTGPAGGEVNDRTGETPLPRPVARGLVDLYA
jgi:flagellar hook-length control protein FliK